MATEQHPRPRPRAGDLLRVGLWGGTTAAAAAAAAAYAVSGGSLPRLVGAMVGIGVLQRVVAYRIVRRRGLEPPRWWWT